jgi:hypothetical protein
MYERMEVLRKDDQDVWLFGGSAAAYIKRRLPNG